MRTKSVIPKTVIKIFIIYVIRLRKLKLGLLASGFKVCRPIGKYLFKVSNKYTGTHKVYAGILLVVSLAGI